MAMLLVFVCIDEGEEFFLPVFFDEGVHGVVVFQFGFVFFFESGPAIGVVAVPLSQFGGWRNIFCPFLEVGIFLFYSAWPEPVDEDADAVRFGGGFVCAFDLDGGMHGIDFLFHVQSQRTTCQRPASSWWVSMVWNPTF